MSKKKWTDEEILIWAKIYSSKRISFMDFENKFGVSHSTVSWCFRFRLPHINYDLYESVATRVTENIHKH